MDSVSDFRLLIGRARTADPEAVAELVKLYEADVRRAARAALGPGLQHLVDSVDLVQSIHRSLLAYLQRDATQPESPAHLCALALLMVRRKIGRQWRKERRHRSWSESADTAVSHHRTAEHDPARAVLLDDQVQNLLDSLDLTDRQVVELRLMGYNTAAAARMLGIDADILRVRLSRLRRALKVKWL